MSNSNANSNGPIDPSLNSNPPQSSSSSSSDGSTQQPISSNSLGIGNDGKTGDLISGAAGRSSGSTPTEVSTSAAVWGHLHPLRVEHPAIALHGPNVYLTRRNLLCGTTTATPTDEGVASGGEVGGNQAGPSGSSSSMLAPLLPGARAERRLCHFTFESGVPCIKALSRLVDIFVNKDVPVVKGSSTAIQGGDEIHIFMAHHQYSYVFVPLCDSTRFGQLSKEAQLLPPSNAEDDGEPEEGLSMDIETEAEGSCSAEEAEIGSEGQDKPSFVTSATADTAAAVAAIPCATADVPMADASFVEENPIHPASVIPAPLPTPEHKHHRHSKTHSASRRGSTAHSSPSQPSTTPLSALATPPANARTPSMTPPTAPVSSPSAPAFLTPPPIQTIHQSQTGFPLNTPSPSSVSPSRRILSSQPTHHSTPPAITITPSPGYVFEVPKAPTTQSSAFPLTQDSRSHSHPHHQHRYLGGLGLLTPPPPPPPPPPLIPSSGSSASSTATLLSKFQTAFDAAHAAVTAATSAAAICGTAHLLQTPPTMATPNQPPPARDAAVQETPPSEGPPLKRRRVTMNTTPTFRGPSAEYPDPNSTSRPSYLSGFYGLDGHPRAPAYPYPYRPPILRPRQPPPAPAPAPPPFLRDSSPPPSYAEATASASALAQRALAQNVRSASPRVSGSTLAVSSQHLDELKNKIIAELSTKIIKPEAIPYSLTDDLASFPYFMAPSSRDFLLHAAYVPLHRPDLHRYSPNFKTYGRLAHNLMLSGPPGSEIYQEVVARALAKATGSFFLAFDRPGLKSVSPAATDEPWGADLLQPPSSSTPLLSLLDPFSTRPSRISSSIPSGGGPGSKRANIKENDRVTYVPAMGSRHPRSGLPSISSACLISGISSSLSGGGLAFSGKPPFGARGRVEMAFEQNASRNKVGVVFDEPFGGSDLGGLCPPGHGCFVSIDDLVLEGEGSGSEEGVVMQALFTVVQMFQPCVLFIRNPDSVCCGSSERFVAFRKAVEELSTPCLIITRSVKTDSRKGGKASGGLRGGLTALFSMDPFSELSDLESYMPKSSRSGAGGAGGGVSDLFQARASTLGSHKALNKLFPIIVSITPNPDEGLADSTTTIPSGPSTSSSVSSSAAAAAPKRTQIQKWKAILVEDAAYLKLQANALVLKKAFDEGQVVCSELTDLVSECLSSEWPSISTARFARVGLHRTSHNEFYARNVLASDATAQIVSAAVAHHLQQSKGTVMLVPATTSPATSPDVPPPMSASAIPQPTPTSASSSSSSSCATIPSAPTLGSSSSSSGVDLRLVISAASLSHALDLSHQLEPARARLRGAALAGSATGLTTSSGVSVENIVVDNDFEKRLLGEVVSPAQIKVSFDQIGALEKVKQVLREVVMLPLTKPSLYQQSSLLRPCKGVLLFGPPGTGKTMLAKAIATEAKAHFLNLTTGHVTSKWFGEAEKLVQAAFSLARKLAPCIIFVDEVDSLLGKRSGDGHEHEGMRKLKNEFMAAWDGLKSSEFDQVTVLAATNRPMDLDDAVLRRLPRRILVDLPSPENIEKILRVILKDEPLNTDVDVAQLSTLTKGYSGSDLKQMCVAAAYRTVRDYLHQHAEAIQSPPNPNAMNVDEESDEPMLRQICMTDFQEAIKEVGASVHEDELAISELRKWNEVEKITRQYEAFGKRRKSSDFLMFRRV